MLYFSKSYKTLFYNCIFLLWYAVYLSERILHLSLGPGPSEEDEGEVWQAEVGCHAEGWPPSCFPM